MLGLLSLGVTQAQKPPSCEQLLEHLNHSFTVAYSVTSTVDIRSGVIEIAYNRSRFERQGNNNDVKVTLLEQRGRRTRYDQNVFLENPPYEPTHMSTHTSTPESTSSQTADDDLPLPFSCSDHDLNVQEANIQETNVQEANIQEVNIQNIQEDNPPQQTRYVLTLTNTQGDIPVSFWRLEFAQQGTWYVLEQLFAPFEITILSLPVRGHFTIIFDGWDLPARLPLSPRESLN